LKKENQKEKRLKIFVTVGTHPQQFNRLIKEMEKIAQKGKYEIFAQTGFSDYKPNNFKHKNFLGIEEFSKKISWADIVIMHAGAGTFGACNRMEKKIIVVPRMKNLEEHTDNHQLELAKAIQEKGLGIAVTETSKLEETIEKAKEFKPKKLENGNIIKIIENYLEK
jgi:UDP-N-acetylglucosamine transferase subunit ALG13